MNAKLPLAATLDVHDLTIERARSTDVRELVSLSAKLGHSETAWRSLIAAENVACARARNGRVLGFYAANDYPDLYQGDQLGNLRAAHAVLCNRFKLAADKVAFGAHVSVTPEWANTDLRGHLLRALLRTVGFRYRHFFSSCAKLDAAEFRALQREGWRVFQEEDEVCYMVLDVAKALRGLASQLAFSPRMQKAPYPASTALAVRQA